MWGERDSGGGWHSHQENSHGTHQLSWQILPTKTLTKDKPPTFLTCYSLQHQEEQSTEDGQDPHAWESPAGPQLWGEEKGGRGEWEGPFLQVRHLHRDRTEERGCDQSLLGGCTRQPRVGASWHQQEAAVWSLHVAQRPLGWLSPQNVQPQSSFFCFFPRQRKTSRAFLI